MAGQLAASLVIHALGLAADHTVVDTVFDILGAVGHLVEPQVIGVVVGKEQFDALLVADLGVPPAVAAQRMRGPRRPGADGFDHGARLAVFPRPGVAIPDMGEHVKRRGVWPAIGRRDTAQQVFAAGLGVLDLDIEVPVGQKRVAQRVE